MFPWLTTTMKMPIPYVALMGTIMEFSAYLGLTVDSQVVSMISSMFLLVGFSFAASTSVSIISVRERDVIEE